MARPTYWLALRSSNLSSRADRKSLRSEVLTHVSGMKCYMSPERTAGGLTSALELNLWV